MIGSDTWDQHWEAFAKISLLNPANQYRSRFILNQIPSTPLHILDIGCGQGYLVSQLLTHRKKALVFGVDFSETSIAMATKNIPRAHFFHMDILQLPQVLPNFIDKKMDIGICSEVLEHLDDPVTFLKNTKTFLKKDASLIITVPGGLRTSYDKYLGHRKHYTKKSLTEILQHANYKVEKIWVAGFPFFNLYKILILLRGNKLIQDAQKTDISFFQKTLSKLFSFLFQFNLPHSFFGWQLIAKAKPLEDSHE